MSDTSVQKTVINSENSVDSTTSRMGTAPIGRTLAAMAWPGILSMTINALYNIVDSIFVARISQEALTAVSFVMPMQLIMVAMNIGTGVGVNSLISRRLGEKRYDEANMAASTGLRLALVNYLVFLCIGLFFTEPFFRHYDPSPTIFEHGTIYMKYVFILSLFTSLELMLQKIMQATGNMVGPMVCAMTGAITNIILDPILIFGLFGLPALGVAGAAIATVIGQFFALLVAIYFIKRQHTIKLQIKNFKPNWSVVKDIYSVGFPAIVMQAISSVMVIGYNTILAVEPVAVAVLGVYQKLQSFIFMPVIGINQGAMPLIGYNYGARNKERLMKTYKLALISALIIMTFGFLLFQIFPEIFLKLFNADENMMKYGVPALRRISICFFPAAFGIITSALFQATGHAFYSLFASLIRQLVGILPLAYILHEIGGAELSWFSFPLAEILGTLYLTLMLLRLYRRKIKNL